MNAFAADGMSGVLLVDKPAGFTSFDVVAKIRGMSKIKRVGHAGTLDPAATGVLPLFLGGATKFISHLPRQDKRYIATFELGVVTDTQDLTGKILETAPVTVGVLSVREMLARFEGEQSQLPPMYSAVRVNGKRLYEMARNGVMDAERIPRTVTFTKITLVGFREAAGRYTIDVSCSKGAYIRTLCHDIGRKLGCGAALAELRRTEACGFTLDSCRTLEDLQALADKNEFAAALTPGESVFLELPRIELDIEQERLFKNGVRLSLDRLRLPSAHENEEKFAVFTQGNIFLGLARPESRDGLLHHIFVNR